MQVKTGEKRLWCKTRTVFLEEELIMMKRRGKTLWGTPAITATSVTLGLAAALFASAGQAHAQDIERVLAGIRLNSKSSTVLAKYSNPNQVVIGDAGVGGFAPGGGAAGQGDPGGGGDPRGGDPRGGGLPSLSGGGGRSGPPTRGGFGGGGGPVAGPPGGFRGGGGPQSGPPGGFGGGGFGGTADGDGGGFGGPPGGFGGGDPRGGGNAGGGVGGFGNTVSTLAQQQEVTWVYNRKVKNDLVSYNFLIGPNGNVIQIRVAGYSDSATKTKRGIGLGSTYKDVVKAYGYPEEHARYGRVLVASYRSRAHVSFQFLNQTPQSNPFASGNKVIAITIATVE